MEWQPIESAPKDGTVIIVHGERMREKIACDYAIVFWVNQNETKRELISRQNDIETYSLRTIERGYWGTDIGEAMPAMLVTEITHWMPLPPPPVE